MFKKIELWIVSLIFLIFIIISILFGAVLNYHYNGGTLFPKIRKTAVFIAEIPRNVINISFGLNKKGQLLITNQDDMPPIFNKHKNKKKFERFIFNDREALLVLPRYDGDLKRSIVEVIDLNDFKVLHTYSHDINSMNDLVDTNQIEHKRIKIDDSEIRFEYRSPIILSDGSLISHSEYAPLFKIDICSNLLWINQEERFHHSIEKDEDQNLWVSSQMYPYSTVVNNFITDYGFSDDSIAKVSADGKIIFIKSVSEILIENEIFKKNLLEIYDPIHLNDIEPAINDSKYWKKGDLFLSSARLTSIIQYRPSTNKIIRYLEGPFSWQHDIDIISDKEISIFNNNNTAITKNYSEILIYNFETKKFSKKFNNQLKNNNFKTDSQGVSTILKDNSLFVEEQNHGRLIFFDKNGEKEWEFINKDSNGNIYFISWSRIIEDKGLISNLKKNINNKKCQN
tara:strand:+ start:6020 stop:7381 length:1362 start_codon:yes stop_codon:yes gene_type:complete